MYKDKYILDLLKSLSHNDLRKFSISLKRFDYLIENKIIFENDKFKDAFKNLFNSKINIDNHLFLKLSIEHILENIEDLKFCVYKNGDDYCLFTMKKENDYFILDSKLNIKDNSSFYVYFSKIKSEFLEFDSYFSIKKNKNFLDIKDTIGLINKVSYEAFQFPILFETKNYICFKEFIFYVKNNNGKKELIVNINNKLLNLDNIKFLDSIKKYLLNESSKFDIINDEQFNIIKLMAY